MYAAADLLKSKEKKTNLYLLSMRICVIRKMCDSKVIHMPNMFVV